MYKQSRKMPHAGEIDKDGSDPLLSDDTFFWDGLDSNLLNGW